VSAREGPAGLGQAKALLEEALAFAKSLDMRPLAALCHLTLGVLLQDNRSGGAGGHLGLAFEMLQRMGMAFWLTPTTASPCELSARATRA
jgi:hypothetical protein